MKNRHLFWNLDGINYNFILISFQLNGGPAGYTSNGGIAFDEMVEVSECFNVS